MCCHNLVLTFESVDELQSVIIHVKATEQCFFEVLFMLLDNVALYSGSVVGLLKCDYSKERW